ncbi:glucosaminidase domain-containing protein [Paraburkholderia sp. SIMBA_030]
MRQFIDTHLAAAQEVQRRYQVPAGVVIAQSALESNWGRSVVGNAYFGVKGRAPGGDSTTFTTHEVINGKAIKIDDAFRAYGSYEEAATTMRKCFGTIRASGRASSTPAVRSSPTRSPATAMRRIRLTQSSSTQSSARTSSTSMTRAGPSHDAPRNHHGCADCLHPGMRCPSTGDE